MKWTQRNGTQIDIKDMEVSHLTNTIAMLERNFQTAMESGSLMQILGRMVPIEEVYPNIVDLRAELVRRLDKSGDVDDSTKRFQLLELE